MPTIKIKSLVQGILSDEEYSWVLQHLFESLPLMSVTYMHGTGKVWHIAVFRDMPENDDFTCVTLFVDDNQLQYELEGLQP